MAQRPWQHTPALAFKSNFWRVITINVTGRLETYIGDITFDVANPRVMAEFWAEALHYDIQEITATVATIVDPNGLRPRCCFQKVATPKVGKNRIHLDLYVADMEAEVKRLIDLGARKLRIGHEDNVVWTVMLDVEGNEFCVQPPPSAPQRG